MVQLSTHTFQWIAKELMTNVMNLNVNLIWQFMDDTQLFDLWQNHPVDFTYSFESENGRSSYIILDHILTLKRSESEITEAGVIHHVRNLSDHEVPYAKIKSTKVEISDSAENKSNKAKPSWKDASPDNKLEYEDVLFRKLLTMDVPDCLQLCSNQKCQDEQHIAAIDDYAKEILANISESASEAIPIKEIQNNKKVDSHSKKIAGWKEFIEPFQKDAQFWY